MLGRPKPQDSICGGGWLRGGNKGQGLQIGRYRVAEATEGGAVHPVGNEITFRKQGFIFRRGLGGVVDGAFFFDSGDVGQWNAVGIRAMAFFRCPP